MSSIKIGDDSSLKINSIKSEKQFSEIKELSLIKASHSKNKSYDIRDVSVNNFMKSTLETEVYNENSSLNEEVTIKLCFMSSKFCKMRKITLHNLINYNKFKSFSIKEMMGFKQFIDVYYSKINLELLKQVDPIIRTVGFNEKGESYNINSEDEWNKFMNHIRFGGSFSDSSMLSSYLKTGKPKFYIILKNEADIKLEMSLKSKNEYFLNETLDIIYDSIIKDKSLKLNLVDYIKDDCNIQSNISNSSLVEMDQTIYKQDNDHEYLIKSLFDELKRRIKFHDEVKQTIQIHEKNSNFSLNISNIGSENDDSCIKIKLEPLNLRKIENDSSERKISEISNNDY